MKQQRGDALYTFTDGYCDQFGTRKERNSIQTLPEFTHFHPDKSMPEQRETLNKTIDDWRGELEQIYDICVFVVKV